MTCNYYIECNQCGTKYRLRWQIDGFDARIMIRCPECKSKITGILRESKGDDFEIHNAKKTYKETDVDYVQEISTVFLTHKLTPASEFHDNGFTPFIRSFSYYKTNLNVIAYLQFIKDYPNEVELIHDLFDSKDKTYLNRKLLLENNAYISICRNKIKPYILNSNLDYLMAGHQYIMTMLCDSGLRIDVENTIKKINSIRQNNLNEVRSFSELMDINGYYKQLNNKFPKLVELFNKNYVSFVAPLMVYDYSSSDLQLEEYGLSSVDYCDLLDLYRKCYEFIGEFSIYIIGLNNIDARGSYNNFKRGTFDIENRINHEDKYNRIQSFIKEGEIFSDGYCDRLNKVIRNADAHFDTEYDVFTQNITFTNKGKNNSSIENMYLFQFARETISVFELVVKLWEIAYQLQKIRMILDLKEDWNYGNPYKILSMV